MKRHDRRKSGFLSSLETQGVKPHLEALASLKGLMNQIEQASPGEPLKISDYMAYLRKILPHEASSNLSYASDEQLLGQYVIDKAGVVKGKVVCVILRPSGRFLRLDKGHFAPLEHFLIEPRTSFRSIHMLSKGIGQSPLTLFHTSFAGDIGPF